jgi:hypothetical protein
LGLLWDPLSTPGLSFKNKTDDSEAILNEDKPSSRPRLPRGLVAPGYAADLVLFNPDIVRDRETFKEPNKQCAGIEWVLINGVVAVERGAL